MRPVQLRGFATISSTWGLQNFTWSLRTSNINRYLRTWVIQRVDMKKEACLIFTVSQFCVITVDNLFETLYLVEDESLADVAPVADRTQVVDEH